MPQDQFEILFLNVIEYCFTFSLCSGLIVTSYSKYTPDNSYKRVMSKTIQQYKDFKNIHVVDEDRGNFPGTRISQRGSGAPILLYKNNLI